MTTASIPRFRLSSPVAAFIAVLVILPFAAGIGSIPPSATKILLLAAITGTAVLLVFRPRIGMAALVALMPFDARVSVAQCQIDTNVLALIVATVILLPRIRVRAVPRWAAIGAFVLLLGTAVAANSAVDGSAAWTGVLWWAICIIPFMAAFNVLREGEGRAMDALIVIIMVTGAVVSVLAVAQKTGHYAIVGPSYSPDRIDSTFGYYTQFGAFMALTAVVSVCELVQAWSKERRWRCVGAASALACAGGGLTLSLSRGALLSASVAFLTVLLLQLRRPTRALGALASVGAVTLGAALLIPSLVSGLRDRFVGPFGSSHGDAVRLAAHSVAARLLDDSFRGIGFGNFRYYFQYDVSASSGGARLYHAQSLFLQVGLDSGWFGLAGFLLLVSGAVLVGLRWASTGALSIRAAGLVGCLVGFLVQGYGDYLLFEVSFMAFFLMLVWAITAECPGRHKPQSESEPSESSLRAGGKA